MKIENKFRLFIIACIAIIGVYIKIDYDNRTIEELNNKVVWAEKSEAGQKEAYDNLSIKFEALNERYIEAKNELAEPKNNIDETELYKEILGFDIDNIEKVDKTSWYYYSLLNKPQKELYENILKVLVKQEVYITDAFTNEVIIKILRSIEYDQPEIFYINFHDKGIVTYDEKNDNYAIRGIAYSTFETLEEIDKAWKEIKDYEKKALQNINQFMSEEEIEKHIYNYIALRTLYIEGAEYNQSMYSIVKQESVCSGYAKMFKFLCNRAGVKCICVRGIHNTSNIGHLWNIVKIKDINYMVDCTNALKADKDKNVYMLYNFFNTSREFMEVMYTVDEWTTIPEVIHE